MRSQSPSTQRGGARRGVALVVVLLFIVAFGALALSATFLTANANLTSKSYDKESELRYVAEAALAIGKSRVNTNAAVLPDTGYKTLMSAATMKSADGTTLPGVKVNLYIGPSGSTSGQFGRFASVISEARDLQGNGFVRRLELSQESFAKFAYWTDKETNSSGTVISFGNGDNIWGPVFTNDNINILSSGATFHDQVETGGTVKGANYGTFDKGYKQNVKPIALPAVATLSKLASYASAAGFNLTAPTSGDENNTRMRIEFLAADLDASGDSVGADEGFFRVYTLASAAPVTWLRADWPGSGAAVTSVTQCGDWHKVAGFADKKFFPASVHKTTWFRSMVQAGGLTLPQAQAESSATLATIMNSANARCYLGGDPHLVAVQRTAAAYPFAADRQKGGDDTTFTATDPNGAWTLFNSSPAPKLSLARKNDAKYLFPLYRGLNPGSQGVIYVSGSVAITGVVRGKVTLYSTATVTILDDVRYANDPGLGNCQDMFGIIAGNEVAVANNAINTPQVVATSGSTYKNLDDTKDLYLHAVIMTLNTSFRVEDYSAAPNNASDCLGSNDGRGCLFLTGGLIQARRGAVGLASGEGYVKRYSYDRCAALSPPPYFPTTGRFSDNRYYELDPVAFDIAKYFKSISSGP